MLNSDRGCYDMGGAYLPLSLSSENVLWAVETAGVDCAETNVASLFSEFPKYNSWTLEFKAKSRQLHAVVSENRIEVARLKLFFEDAVLFDQVGNHDRLLTTDPAGERGQEELKMDDFNHAASVSDQR
jgi:hypothetical protein